MRITRIMIGIFLLITVQASVCNAKEFSAATRKQLQEAAEKVLADYGGKTSVPGAIVGVWYPGKGNWVKGVGVSDIVTEAPINVESNVRIGSNTKTFVVTVLLQLADEGKVDFDDTLDKFDIGVKIPNARKITLKQLCNMTSGLYEVYEAMEKKKLINNPLTVWDAKEQIEIAVARKPYFAPGKSWHYTNTGYLMLGLIIEKITGNKLEDEIQNRIIKPLKLENTTMPETDPGMPCPYLHGYQPDDSGGWKDATVTYNPSLAWAAGSIISNLSDMKKWVKDYVTGTTNSKETQKERMECVETGKDNVKFGLGIVCTGGWYGYTGGLDGYNTAVYYLPEKDATVIAFIGSKRDKPEPGVANVMLREITKILFPENIAM